MPKIPVEISARHIHLSQKDLDALFGKGFKLKKIKDLSQPGEFASSQTVELIGPKSSYKKVRVIGPVRKNTQVEITATDCRVLGINAPVRLSGNVKGSAQATIKGPKARIKLKQGVIIAQRHLHLSAEEAKKLKVRNNQKVSVRIKGERSITFHEVVVRAGRQYKKACHLDTDEGNSAGMKTCEYGELVK
ncbi:phosphate propanoyltransferase [Patescibacteria group bacterium]|nr:phosphate propanoyltransferase [Patescibacteria group bacterium]